MTTCSHSGFQCFREKTPLTKSADILVDNYDGIAFEDLNIRGM